MLNISSGQITKIQLFPHFNYMNPSRSNLDRLSKLPLNHKNKKKREKMYGRIMRNLLLWTFWRSQCLWFYHPLGRAFFWHVSWHMGLGPGPCLFFCLWIRGQKSAMCHNFARTVYQNLGCSLQIYIQSFCNGKTFWSLPISKD